MLDLFRVLDNICIGVLVYGDNLEIRYSNRTSSVLASKLETPGLLYDEIKELARQSRIQSAPKTRFLFSKPTTNTSHMR